MIDHGTLQASFAAILDLSVVTANLGLYFTGLLLTVKLLLISLLIGFVLAVPCGVALADGPWWLRGPVWLYTYAFRGTPLLVQLFIIYYGLGQFSAVRTSFLWPYLREAWLCALIAFSLNTAAYTAEILRGAIQATPRGEQDAARAFGMSPWQRYRRVILPGAFRRALPAYGNEVIFMLHGTSLASVVTLIDITGAARIVNSRYYTPYEAFLTAAALYLALTFAIVMLFRNLEWRMFVHLRPRGSPGKTG